MTALGADRSTPVRDGVQLDYPAAASKTFYAGALVVLDSSGNAEPGTTATGKIAVGRCEKAMTSGGVAAVESVPIRRGTFRWANGSSITKAHIGDTAYVVDDATVSNVSTGKSPAGIIVDVDSLGVWVLTDPGNLLASTGLLAANNLSDVGSTASARTSIGLGTTDAPTFDDLTITDDLVVGDDGTFSGKLDVAEAITGLQKLVAGGAAYTVGSAADGGCIITTATDNAVITLPDAAAGNAGKRITVVNTGGDGTAKVSVSPHSSDSIRGTVAAVTASGTADKDIINTKLTALRGDYITLFSDGSSSWYIVGGAGIWASE